MYDDAFRASALAALEAAGYPHRRGALIGVSRGLGVPVASLRRWLAPSSSDRREGRVDDLRTAARDELLATVRRMGQTRDEASYKELTGAFVALAEKLQTWESAPGPFGAAHDGPEPGEARQRLAEQLAERIAPPGKED
jgi:hypothetical protein